MYFVDYIRYKLYNTNNNRINNFENFQSVNLFYDPKVILLNYKHDFLLNKKND